MSDEEFSQSGSPEPEETEENRSPSPGDDEGEDSMGNGLDSGNGRERGKTAVYIEEDDEGEGEEGDGGEEIIVGFEVKQQSPGSGVTKIDVEDHFTRARNIKWADWAHEPLCCGVDSSSKAPHFFSPGGEFAEFILALNIYEKLSDTFVDEMMCATFLKAQLAIDPKDAARKNDRPFVFHTSADAIARLAAAVNYEGDEPFNLLDPPEDLIPDLEAEVSKTENFGCAYLKLLLEQSDDFFTRKKLIRICTTTLFSLLWMSNKKTKKEDEEQSKANLGNSGDGKMKRRNSLSSFLKSVREGEDDQSQKNKDGKKKEARLGAGEKKIGPEWRRIKIMIDTSEQNIVESPPMAVLKMAASRTSGRGGLAAAQNMRNADQQSYIISLKAVQGVRKMLAESVSKHSQRFIDEKQLFKSMNDLGNAQLEQLVKFTAKSSPTFQVSYSFSLAKREQAKRDLVVFLKAVEVLTGAVETEGTENTVKRLTALEASMREGELNEMRIRSPELAERLLGMIKAVQRLVELRFDARDQVLKEYKQFEGSAVKMIKTVPYISSKYVPLLSWVQEPIEKATTNLVQQVRQRMDNVEMDVSIKLYLAGMGGTGEYSLAMDALKAVEKVKYGKADAEEKKLAARLTSRKSAIEAMKILEHGEGGSLPRDLAEQRKESIMKHIERIQKNELEKRRHEMKIRRAEQKAQKAVLRNVNTGSVVSSQLSASLSGSLNSTRMKQLQQGHVGLDVVSELSVSDAGMTEDKALGIISRLQMKKGLLPQSPGYSHLFRGPESNVTTEYASSIDAPTDTESMAGSISKYQLVKKNNAVEDAWNQLEAEDGSMLPHPPNGMKMKSKSPVNNRAVVPGEVYDASAPSMYRSMPSSRSDTTATTMTSTNPLVMATMDRAKAIDKVQEMNSETTKALLLARAIRQRNEAKAAAGGMNGSQTARV